MLFLRIREGDKGQNSAVSVFKAQMYIVLLIVAFCCERQTDVANYLSLTFWREGQCNDKMILKLTPKELEKTLGKAF